MISYNVVVGDTLSKVLIRFVPSWDTSMGFVRFGVVLAVTVCVVIPLCLYKNVSRLARASFISLACVVFILFAVICKFFSGDYDAVWVNDLNNLLCLSQTDAMLSLIGFIFQTRHTWILEILPYRCNPSYWHHGLRYVTKINFSTTTTTK